MKPGERYRPAGPLVFVLHMKPNLYNFIKDKKKRIQPHVPTNRWCFISEYRHQDFVLYQISYLTWHQNRHKLSKLGL